MTFNTYNPTKEDLIANAPEGATHYSLETESDFFSWYKKDSDGVWMFKFTDTNDYYSNSWKEDVDDQVRIAIPFMEVGDTDVSQGVSENLSDPVTIRKRILEIRKEREAGSNEEQELIDKLASMGFKLIEEINENLEEAKEQHNLQDWRNWKAGDLLERVDKRHPLVYVPGKLYVVKSTEPEICVYDEFGGDSYCQLETDEYEHFKFHSRPTK